MTTFKLIVLALLALTKVTGQCLEICPDGWIRFMNSCYFVGFEQLMTFVESAHYCQQHHAKLLTIETANENAFISDYLKKTRAGNAWLGISDMDIEGIWRWYFNNDIVQYSHWRPGQPDSHDGNNEDCGMLYSGHSTWDDVPCNYTIHPICEKDMDEETPDLVG